MTYGQVPGAVAGAAAELQKGALLVNPHDKEGVANAIHKALEMSGDERRERMKKPHASVRKHDI
jgi:trehalose 6-phosphate synthase/phosphatase